MTTQPPGRRVLPLVLLLLLVLAIFVPLRHQRWSRWVGDKVQFIVAPVSHPLSAMARWLGGGRDTPPSDDAIRVLEEKLEETNAAMLRQIMENQRLTQVITELRVLSTSGSTPPARTIVAPVYATSSDLAGGVVRVVAGEREGVSINTPVTALGMQLVGRVVAVSGRTSSVLPITARSAGTLRAMVMLDNEPNGLICTLNPTGDGTLRGPVESRRDAAGSQPIEPKIGQTVRLADPSGWTPSSQMLLVGVIESVEPAVDQPLRKVVTVRPTIEDLSRVTDVMLLISASAEGPLDDADGPKGGRR
jgi:cell shape-determining protein MreC